jgi:hypothetical protein
LCGAVVPSTLQSVLAFAQTAPSAGPLAPLPTPSSQAAPRPSAAELKNWRDVLAKPPSEQKGCFTAKYPNPQWQKVPCVTPPNVPYRPAHAGGGSIVGNGYDYVATTTKLISSARGVIVDTSGILDEADGGTANRYSLQLNTNTFANTPACNTAKTPSQCKGWEQFVYSNGGSAFIQYWLLNYATTCPGGWNTFGADCWKNAPSAASYGPQPITELQGLTLSGAASAGNDSIVISGADGNASAANVDSVLSLVNFFKNAEFNVFGDCCGSQANFNSGVSILVSTIVVGGSTAAPGCATDGTTGETNNLTLAASCAEVGGGLPAVVFSESNPPGSIWKYTGTPCSGASCPGWQEFDDNNQSVRIAATGSSLYQMWNNGDIWKYTGTPCSGGGCPGWTQIDFNPDSLEIAAGGNNLYQLQNTGKLYLYTGGTSWQLLDDNSTITTVSASSDGVFELHSNGNIWQYTGPACDGESCPGWRQLDDNPKAVAIATGGTNLYQLHNDGTVWKYTGPACSPNGCPGWQLLNNDKNALTIVAGGNNLYQLDTTGTIWKYTGTPCKGSSCTGWKELDNNPAALDIAADEDNNLYELHKTGLIWHYTGPACSAGSCPGWKKLDDNSWTGRIAAASGNLYQIHGPQTPPSRALICYDCR